MFTSQVSPFANDGVPPMYLLSGKVIVTSPSLTIVKSKEHIKSVSGYILKLVDLSGHFSYGGILWITEYIITHK